MTKDSKPINLPSIRTIFPDQGDDPYDMRPRHSSMGNSGHIPLPNEHHSLALMERLPSSDSFHSTSSQQYPVAYRSPPQYAPRKDSLVAAPSPVINAMSSSHAMPIAGELKQEECCQCGSLTQPYSECACGHPAFRYPFQPNGKHLAAGPDDYFVPRPSPRRGSRARCSISSSSSSSSNPPSRRGSCISFAGVTKPGRRGSVQTVKAHGQADNNRLVKAKREKESRKEITSGMKRMEMYLQSIGLEAATDLNANNKSKSGLEHKKSEILELMLKQARENGDELLVAYDWIIQWLTPPSSGKELGKEDLEKLQQFCKYARQRNEEIRAARRKEESMGKEWTKRRAVSPAYCHSPGSSLPY